MLVQGRHVTNDYISLLKRIQIGRLFRRKVVYPLISTIIICALFLYSSSLQAASTQIGRAALLNKKIVNKLDATNSNKNDEEDLYSKVRIFCWVTTQPSSIATKAVAIWNTWGKRCNKIVFITSQPTHLVPAVVVNTSEGRNHLMAKSAAACRYIYEHYLNEYDWFFKADDDTYLIVENLRHFLSKFTASHLTYYGYLFKTMVEQGYYSGGSGFAVSREGMKRVVEDGLNKSKCAEDGVGSDLKMGQCFELVGIKTGDTRDALARERFHPISYFHLMTGVYPSWYKAYAKNPVVQGVECCSEISIALHYVTAQDMYLLDFTIYHLQVHGFHKTSAIDLNQPPDRSGLLTNASDSSIADSKQP